ncbi:uncharacterized MFS-type transporter C09D4.1-like [Thrips palmi]|uniref:Uncharacterized MFS-type transporter C09D4.1-like n=1 Tax=Thrips palmi TaxID=161013 RepID=A0A6P8Y4Y8_THRPL|nr:uncharacterized MFS-type transporter C09D4.1-like [Thrips palmi]XP_034231095.1 uncharacterized MFS-type transporter C09D4.1-like [Thrips palmi]XP_034231096.1 uncharacterized MFS-type transporter C09D4.1-like [Thrips palmi]
MDVVKAAVAEAGRPQIKVYKRRWVILVLYVSVLLLNAVPWMQYTVLADVVTAYYGISYESVEWTALVYNVTATVLVVPAAYFLDKHGLRPSVLLGALLTAAGLWLRVLGCWPEHWWAVLAGHAIVSIATNFLVSAPPRVAAVWFPANEVSSAVGASIVGSMGGVSIGCVLAPMTARASWTLEENFKGFLGLNLALAMAATLLFAAVFFLFKQAPPLPPSPAQAAAAATVPSGNYFASLRTIIKQPSFILLLVCFNLILSVYVAITTVINRDITEFFPDRTAETGYLATLICLTGMVATMVFGIILDKTKKFKELSIITYFGAFASVIMYSVCIATTSMEVLYVVAGIMGVFMTSYFVPAYEMAVELTYPEPEGNPTSILNWFMQPCSLVFTLAYSRIFTAYGPHAAHGLLVALMAVGFVSQLFIPKRYRRREAELSLARDALPAEKPLMKDAKS